METVYAPNTDGYKRMINNIKKHYGEDFEFNYAHEKEIIAFIDKYYYLKYKLF
jgi:hypothetical protein